MIKKIPSNKLTLFGFFLTVIYFIGLIFLLKDRYNELFTVNINELGDFLAGVFGPVAFLWLVIGYLMQHFELKISRTSVEKQAEELELTRQTLEQQLVEFKESVALTKKSNEFNQELQLKREKDIFDANQPIIEKIKICFPSIGDIDNYIIGITYINFGVRANNATFISYLSGESHVLACENIDEGENTISLKYMYRIKDIIYSLSLSINHQQVLDEITIDYVDNRSLQQKSKLILYVTRRPDNSYDFDTKLQQYFNGKLLD